MTQTTTHDVLVIGAGIVGVSLALEAVNQGRGVTIFDRKGVAEETSAGNAGAFAFAEVEPLAAPGILRKAPKWLLDPLGPLSVPPSYALALLPWMVRFWRASWRDRYQRGVAAQVSLMGHCEAAFERQLAADGDPAAINREGQMGVYASEAAFRAALPALKRRQELGIECHILEGAEALAEIQPGLSPAFKFGGYTPGWFNTRDPKEWTLALADRFRAKGGAIDTRAVTRLRQIDGGVEVQTDAGSVTARQVVVAAGAWSHQLAATLGDRIPLETERGYNTTLPHGGAALHTHVTFSEHGFVMSKNHDGVRVGGAVELGGLTLAPNMKRAEVLLDKAKRFFPALDTKDGTQWMGYRPSLPDSLPVIGRATAPDVIYAFGHGHLGLTQSAGTAEIVADLLANRTPALDITPFSPTRF